MNDDNGCPVQESEAIKAAFPRERTAFRSLLLVNPNYFGNLEQSQFEPVLPLTGNTYYEELACVGYHPQQRQLEAVVYLYQPGGYGSGICGPGSTEYVRFYLSYDHGLSWQDQGLTAFKAHNIPEGTEGGKKLEYGVSLAIQPKSRFCLFDPVIQVRAILSWNNPPPANQPNWKPVWGNVRQVPIQIEPVRLIPLPHLFDLIKIKLPSQFEPILDLETPISAKQLSLSAADLSTLYRGAEVPASRFAFKELVQFASGTSSLSAEHFSELLPGIQIDPDILDILFPKTDGNISYEELRCIGLDPNYPDHLLGIIHVKKPAGYSGGPCTKGSTEYVTFWGDFNSNGTFETCLGTAQVQVYDLNPFPDKGVFYAVRLPVNLNPYRQPCSKGPRVVRIRAILSWNVPAPCNNPNHVPTWGNREETLINIDATLHGALGKIAILGGIPVSHISDSTGLTTASAVFATNNLAPDSLGRPCPFAGRVSIQGSPILGHSYKVTVTPTSGGAPATLVTSLTLTRADGTTYQHHANPVTGRFNYVAFNDNVNDLLAHWNSSGDGQWLVRLTVYDSGNNQVGTDTQLVQLDNTGPTASIDITTGTGNCGKFSPGTLLQGQFVARDDYLGSYSLGIDPAVNPAGIGVPTPSSGLVNTSLAGSAWNLDTSGMKPCGYVIRLVVRDRAIVNSQSVGHYASDTAGFCIKDPQEG